MSKPTSGDLEIIVEQSNPVYVALTIVHPEASKPCVIEGWLCRGDTQEYLVIQPSRVYDENGLILAVHFSTVLSIVPANVDKP
jgi:hypothetical protein